jgi:hypothetical protein
VRGGAREGCRLFVFVTQPQPTSFQFDVEAEVFQKTNAKGESEFWVGGICTTDHVDQEGEKLLQRGLDFAPFLETGYFNDNHGRDTGAAVGKPVRAELRKLPDGHQGWYVEGPLYDNPRALAIRDLAMTLERSGDAARKLGFSVEGQILDRDPEDPTTVRRAIVREVAITRCPTNRHATLQRLVKSLSQGTGLPTAGVPRTGEGAGAILSPQALEGANALRKRRKKLSKAEATVLLLRREPRLRLFGAEAIVDYALSQGV